MQVNQRFVPCHITSIPELHRQVLEDSMLASTAEDHSLQILTGLSTSELLMAYLFLYAG